MYVKNAASGVCQYKTKNADMFPTSLKRKRESSSKPKQNANNYNKYIHMKNTNMKIYKK